MTDLRFGRLGAVGRRPLPALHDILWWLLAAAIVLAGAQLFWIVVTPVSPLGNWRPASVRLMPDAARSALMRGFDPFNRNQPQVTGDPGVERITDLPLTLFGIRYNAATGAGTAIVAANDGEQMIYRIGDEVSPGVTLSALTFDHVVLSRGGGRELLYLDQSQPAPVAQPAPIAPVAPPPAGSPKGAEQSEAVSASALKSGIALSPRMVGGNFAGLAVSPGGDGSAFRAAGLQAGDVVTAMGGQRIQSAADAARLGGAFTPGSTISLTVRRDGREEPVNFTVAP